MSSKKSNDSKLIFEKLFAAWWFIAIGITAANLIFRSNQQLTWVGLVIYTGLFFASLYRIYRHKKEQKESA